MHDVQPVGRSTTTERCTHVLELDLEVVRLLTHLVNNGPVVGASRADVHHAAADRLIEDGLAEITAGPDKAVLRATFAGRRLIADMHDKQAELHDAHRRGWPRGLK